MIIRYNQKNVTKKNPKLLIPGFLVC